MRLLLYLTDRLSLRGGADQHLLQVMAAAVDAGAQVTVAYGRSELSDAALPPGTTGGRLKGLDSKVATGSRLGALSELLDACDVVHVQNVMNPVAIERAVATGRAVVTVQDHRLFCPGAGKTLAEPSGERCREVMSDRACAACLPEPAYRARTLELTRARFEACRGARLLVLSRYMADELAQLGLAGAELLPPWVAVPDEPRQSAGDGFLLGGRLVEHKGVLTAWRAWRAAAVEQSLHVAGVGPLEQSLDGAERHGWLPGGELRHLLRRSRALLFPSRWQEPFGILAVEALAEGTPVIVADSGGTGEWSGAGCVVVPRNDVEAMAAAIAELAADADLALRLGREGQEAVRHLFERSRIEQRLRQIYGL